ncbi:alkaline ceramidase 3-like [Pollicipes pollicipes]|uniref:alkaline ceramidase 3-like n=1 Tax=Pollicipes pollicipes TaxID=41117 RepID=UPI001885A219|nr:alkaline ceramidase 3-like [Pollicipes pollicipes]XP_037090180.1 alkaline ceramidase 3-like [Pollicipes pollicipes]XP_037090181.1 alkaline ceramidase 3-like [Pollicipes pollicipes]
MAPVDGFWGQPTSTLDWCEANYVVSSYIAEFWNTVSNLAMILPPLYGIYEVCRQKFEIRFAICFVLLLVVGLGSWAFHMTLLYEMQLSDELPMVFCSCFLLYCLAGIHGIQEGSHLNWLSVAFLVYSALFSLSYLWYPNPIFHQVNYGVASSAITLLDINLLRSQKDRTVRRLFYLGVLLYAVAFGLWNLDNHTCDSLRWLRSVLPPVLRPFTQLHAWWHVFAGYASYIHILYCLKARCNIRHQKSEACFGPMGFTVRRLPSHRAEANGHTDNCNNLKHLD